MERGQRILVDTMVIIAAHDLHCWNALIKHFKVETVEQCVIECATGRRMRRDYVPIDDASLRAGIVVNAVDDRMRADLIEKESSASRLDQGEKDLIAFALTQPSIPLLSTCDKGAITVMHLLKLLNQVVSLEECAELSGMKNLKYSREYKKQWLSDIKWNLQLGTRY